MAENTSDAAQPIIAVGSPTTLDRRRHSLARVRTRRAVAPLVVALAAALLPHPPASAETDDDTSTTSTSTPIESTTTTVSPPSLPKKAEVVYRVPTTERVVFITIDDGFTPTPDLADVIERHKVPITTFAMPRLVERRREWFLARNRMTFENHTVNHSPLRFLPFRAQQREICAANDRLEKTIGDRPKFFRPPGGNFTDITLRAVAACGMKYLVMWNAIAQSGTLQLPNGRLNPGDIILMHYLPSTASTLELLLAQTKKDGLRPALLRDYLD